MWLACGRRWGGFWLEEDERPGAARVIVLGWDTWKSRFGGTPEALGQTVRLGGLEYVVAGVMPEGFEFPLNHRAWIALGAGSPEDRVSVLGRLADGVRMETAKAELAAVGAVRGDNSGASVPVVTTVVPHGIPFQDPKPDAWVFRTIPLLFALLLIPPCANIAILIYARNVTRAGEFAARFVLGAGRGRIIGQLMVEVWVLAACAGGIALVATQWFLDWARQYAERDVEWSRGIPQWMRAEFHVLFDTVLYVVGLVLFCGLVSGGLPALRATGSMAQQGFQGLGSRSGGPRLGKSGRP